MISSHIFLGFVYGVLAAKAYEHMPAKWFCDYGESPGERHSKQSRHLSVLKVMLFALITSGATAAFAYFSNNDSWLNIVSFSLTAAVLLLIALSDIKFNIIPNELLAITLLFGLPLAFRNGYMQPLTGFLVGGGVLFAIFFISSKLLKKEAMGMGDVLLSALCGLLCGAAGYIIVIFTAVFSAALVFTVLLIAKKINKDEPQPFGPFLIAGAIFTLCFWPFWQALLQAYFYL